MTNTAFVFPGQGSQSLGMLGDLAHYPIIMETFAQASQAIGYDVWQLIQTGPLERLNQTEQTQVAMLTADVAIYRLLMQQGTAQAQMMAGHSLGEYAALVCAQALSLADAVQLVAFRGKIMQEAMPLGQGAMAAVVGLTDEQVNTLCEQASVDHQSVSPANYNAIGQVVVAGHTPAVERLIDLAHKADARLAMMIPVSVPCHCPLLKDAAEQFAVVLEKTPFQTPVVPVISNVDLSIYESATQIRTQLKKQLYSPVRWVQTIQLFQTKGIRQTVECGPGKILSGLIKRIDKSINLLSVHDILSPVAQNERIRMNQLKGKIALVTGASRGIGKAIALHLAKNGAFVYGTATTQEGALAINTSFETEQLTGQGIVLDVTNAEQIETLMNQLSDNEQSPSILVNNAGITADNLLLRMSDEEWYKVIETNLNAVYRMSKACLKPMFKARWGRIISISSVVGASGNSGQVNYTAAKAGVVGFSKSLAQEIGSRGITVNVVAPGFIDTDMTANLPDMVKQEMLKRIPLRQLGQVEDIAHAVTFLASDNARYITGETLHVNGGMYMS